MQPVIPYLLFIVLLPLVGIVFLLLAKDDEKTAGENVLKVAALTVIANLALIVRAFMHISLEYGKIQLVEKYQWLENPKIALVFGVDCFALLLMVGIHLAILIGLWGVRNEAEGQKSRMIFTLLFLSFMCGFLTAVDIFSFFIFFEAMLLPLYMMVGMFGEVRRQGTLFRFTLYNLLGALLLFVAIVVIFNHQGTNIFLNKISGVKLGQLSEFMVWCSIFAAFVSRIPIWPFHYWISSISARVKNPLVFIVANILPLTGVYGFMRFWPKTMPDVMIFLVVILEVISVLTMLFIAFIAIINKDIQYKIFSFMTVYYIFYLLGVFLPTDQILLNVGFSIFAFLLIFAALDVMLSFMNRQQENTGISTEGCLQYMPRLSMVFTFMVLAGIGMPLSSMFVNNFVIIAELLNYNLVTSFVALAALILVSTALLSDLYRRKKDDNLANGKEMIKDISTGEAAFMWGVSVILVLSFVNPLWFVRG